MNINSSNLYNDMWKGFHSKSNIGESGIIFSPYNPTKPYDIYFIKFEEQYKSTFDHLDIDVHSCSEFMDKLRHCDFDFNFRDGASKIFETVNLYKRFVDYNIDIFLKYSIDDCKSKEYNFNFGLNNIISEAVMLYVIEKYKIPLIKFLKKNEIDYKDFLKHYEEKRPESI